MARAMGREYLAMERVLRIAKHCIGSTRLSECNAKIKFLSLEPLVEPLGELDLAGIDWVIVGGESGKDFRPMSHAWAREIRDQLCSERDCLFFQAVRCIQKRDWDGIN